MITDSLISFPGIDQTIFLDIETDEDQKKIWLIGLYHKGKITQYWAENFDNQDEILEQFFNYISQYPHHSLIYHSTNHLDLRLIWDIAQNSNLDISALNYRYWISLPIFLRKILPDSPVGYSLKNFATVLGYQFKSRYSTGKEVAIVYEKLLNKHKKITADQIRFLLQYNSDDLKSMEFIINQYDEYIYYIDVEDRGDGDISFLKSKLSINSLKDNYISLKCKLNDLNPILIDLLSHGIINPQVKKSQSSSTLSWSTRKEGGIMINRTKQVLEEIFGDLTLGVATKRKIKPNPKRDEIREYHPKTIDPEQAKTLIKNSDYAITSNYARIIPTDVYTLIDALASCGIQLGQIHVLKDHVKLRWEGKMDIAKLTALLDAK